MVDASSPTSLVFWSSTLQEVHFKLQSPASLNLDPKWILSRYVISVSRLYLNPLDDRTSLKLLRSQSPPFLPWFPHLRDLSPALLNPKKNSRTRKSNPTTTFAQLFHPKCLKKVSKVKEENPDLKSEQSPLCDGEVPVRSLISFPRSWFSYSWDVETSHSFRRFESMLVQLLGQAFPMVSP